MAAKILKVGYPQSIPKFAQLKCVSRKGKKTNNLKNKKHNHENHLSNRIFDITYNPWN
jgi:hypothetical protein